MSTFNAKNQIGKTFRDNRYIKTRFIRSVIKVFQMQKNMLFIVVLLVVSNLVYCQKSPRFEQMRDIYRAICGQNTSKDLLNTAKECEEDLPDLVSSNFAGCVKEVFKVRRVTKPLICYRGQRGGDQVSTFSLLS